MNNFTTRRFTCLCIFLFLLHSFSCRDSGEENALTPPLTDEVITQRALLIGVERTLVNGHDGRRLSSIATDDSEINVNYLKRVLKRKGFKDKDIRTLITEEAKADSVVKEIERAANEATSGDLFVLYFTGHGIQLNGEDYLPTIPELDGKDEGIVAYDAVLTDNKLYEALSQFKSGVEVVLMFDCCHAGSIWAMNLPNCSSEICNPIAYSDIPTYKQKLSQNKAIYETCSSSIFRTVVGYNCKVLYLGSSLDSTSTGIARIAASIKLSWPVSQLGRKRTFCDFLNTFISLNINNVVVETSDNVDTDFLYRDVFTTQQ